MAADILPQGRASTGPVPSPPPQCGSPPAPAGMDLGAATVTLLLSWGAEGWGPGPWGRESSSLRECGLLL